jgi:hypothetical protein
LFAVVVVAAAAPVVVLIKSRKIRWVRHASCTREKRNLCRILMGNPKEKILEVPDIYERIILKYKYQRNRFEVYEPDSYGAENHKRQATVITLTDSSFPKPQGIS